MGRLLEKIEESKKKSTHIYTLSDILTLLLEEAHTCLSSEKISPVSVLPTDFIYTV